MKMKMKIDVTYISRRHYTKSTMNQWRWYYKPNTHINGFILRIFGIYFNVREHNATEKLIELARK